MTVLDPVWAGVPGTQMVLTKEPEVGGAVQLVTAELEPVAVMLPGATKGAQTQSSISSGDDLGYTLC